MAKRRKKCKKAWLVTTAKGKKVSAHSTKNAAKSARGKGQRVRKGCRT